MQCILAGVEWTLLLRPYFVLYPAFGRWVYSPPVVNELRASFVKPTVSNTAAMQRRGRAVLLLLTRRLPQGQVSAAEVVYIGTSASVPKIRESNGLARILH